MTAIVFPADHFSPRNPDEAFAGEAVAAAAAGFDMGVIGRVTGDAIYRGWMLSIADYENLYRSLKLINDPAQYRLAHHFPESYPLIAAMTPRSLCIPIDQLNWEKLPQQLRDAFGERPLMLKDWVKSRKHEWDEACFIPRLAQAERVARRFLELQAEFLVGGLVFREFEEFESREKEARIFYLDHQPLIWSQQPPLEQLQPIAEKIRSRFFTIDVARRKDGEWRIVEVGDGQVSGLPASISPESFYESLRARVPA